MKCTKRSIESLSVSNFKVENDLSRPFFNDNFTVPLVLSYLNDNDALQMRKGCLRQ